MLISEVVPGLVMADELVPRQLGAGAVVVAAIAAGDISRFFPPIDRIFPGETVNPFFGAQDEGFSEFRSR